MWSYNEFSNYLWLFSSLFSGTPQLFYAAGTFWSSGELYSAGSMGMLCLFRTTFAFDFFLISVCALLLILMSSLCWNACWVYFSDLLGLKNNWEGSSGYYYYYTFSSFKWPLSLLLDSYAIFFCLFSSIKLFK